MKNFYIFSLHHNIYKDLGKKFSKKKDVIIDEVDGLRQFKKFEKKVANKFDNPIFTKDKNIEGNFRKKKLIF